MLKFIIPVIMAFTCVVGAGAVDATLDKNDINFVNKAAIGGMLEVRTSEIALKRGVTGKDKEFAQMMIDDHKAANKELKSIADKKGIVLPTELDATHQSKVEKLAKSDDKHFSEDYIESQVAAHKEAVDLFEDQSKNGKDEDLKAFARETLPTLTKHLEHAKKINKDK